MGLLKWLARVGAVGGLVRSFADGYKTMRTANPDHSILSDKEIFRVMVDARMSTLPNAGQRSFIEPFLVNPSKGLRHLIIGILMAENSSADAFSFSVLPDSVYEVIDEELNKSGLPKSVIEGLPEPFPSSPRTSPSPLSPSISPTTAERKIAPTFIRASIEPEIVCPRCNTVVPQSQRGAHYSQCPKCETIIKRNA